MTGNTLSDFAAYFRQLAAEHVELAGSFVHGSAGRIISGSRSGIKYPCLWLETPTLHLSEKDMTSAPDGRRTCAFVILKNVPSTDYAAQDAGWEYTERIALDVLSRMREDRKKRLFAFKLNDSALEPVATLTVDNEIGWRYEFEIGNPLVLRYDASRWVQL
jgi:hypothetical protein